MIVSPRNDRDNAPMNSQQYDCLNKNGTVTIPDDITVWMGEIPEALTLDEELQVINGVERGRSAIFRDECPQRLSNPK